MAIGIGIHCWYCEHGPCNGECKTDDTFKKQEVLPVTEEAPKGISGETRPWGSFQVIRDEEDFKAKVIEVEPGGRLSKQYHFHRDETWVVASGVALVTVGNKTFTAMPGDVIKIGRREIHRVENPADRKLVFLELQLGDYFGEDDIVRIEDDYNRE